MEYPQSKGIGKPRDMTKGTPQKMRGKLSLFGSKANQTAAQIYAEKGAIWVQKRFKAFHEVIHLWLKMGEI